MRKLRYAVTATLFVLVAQANEMTDAQKLGEEMGTHWTGNVGSEAEGYLNTLSQSHPFSSPNEKHMVEQGTVELYQNELGQMVYEQKNNNPDWIISERDQLHNRAEGYQNCDATYQTAICLETPKIMEGVVEELRVEKITPEIQNFKLDIYASSYAEKRTTFYFDLKNGSLAAQEDANSTHGWSIPKLEEYDCRYLSFQYSGSIFYDDPDLGGTYHTEDVVLDAPTQPTCTNGLTTSFSISQTHHKKNKWKKRGVKHTFQVTYQPPPQYREVWYKLNANQTQYPENCTIQDICLKGPLKKWVEGEEVYRECWKRQRTYICATPSIACEKLRENGCEQLTSSCQTENSNHLCSQFKLEFRCPQSSCEPKKENISAYCLEGECFEPKHETLEGFEKAVSHLSGVMAAGSGAQMNEIFKGQAMTCRKMGIGFSDCCKDKGWGQDLHLMSCKEEEKLLGRAKEAERVIEVGEYCDKKAIGGGCIEKKKSYCVYPSKLARIIQQGAIVQLGRPLGNVENPSCAPLSAQDLQDLDWDKIDFSPLYADIQGRTKALDPNQFKEKMMTSLIKNNTVH